jgi:hypothetical protein
VSNLGPAAQRDAAAFARRDPFWPAQLTVLAAVLLSLDLPSGLTIRPVWLIPAIEGVLLVALVAMTPRAQQQTQARRAGLALVLIGLVSASNLLNLVLLTHRLLHGPSTTSFGHALILAGVEIWITNVLLFAVWFWELDRGGPLARRADELRAPDFLFPQMTDPRLGGIDWRGRLHRLPLHVVHQRHGVQPDRHDAAQPDGEDADGGPVGGLAGDDRDGRRARRQHHSVSAPPRGRAHAARPANH